MTEQKDDQQGFIMKDAPEETVAEDAAQPEDHIPLPEINFSTFVVSLNASALMHLGLMEDPIQGEKVKNLELGKQTIDILVILEPLPDISAPSAPFSINFFFAAAISGYRGITTVSKSLHKCWADINPFCFKRNDLR